MGTLQGISESRIAADLAAAAAAGAPGDRLPSVRELSSRHQASPVTVQRAIARLAAEGIVDPRPGSGTFIARRAAPEPSADVSWQEVALGGRATDVAGLDSLLSRSPEDALVLSTGYLDADLQPTAALAQALSRAARRPGAWERPPADGVPELRAWFAAQVGGGLRAQDAIITSGGQPALVASMRAVAQPGETVLVESPTYVGALAAARAAGRQVVPVPADADGVRPDHLSEAFTRTGARAFYCQPTWANPHGALLSTERRTAVLQIAEQHSAFVIEDDWARDFAIDRDAPPPLVASDLHGHVVYLRSLTKSAAPGLRVGAVIARGPIVARLRAVRLVGDLFVSAPLQHAALDLVSSPAWRTHLRSLRAALRSRRDHLAGALATELPELTLARIPTGGLHLWARLPGELDDAAVAQAALAAGVTVSPGRHWFAAEAPGPYLRLSFAGAAPDQLAAAVARLRPAVTSAPIDAAVDAGG